MASPPASIFWRSIGSPTCVGSPMVEQSELAYRLLCRRYNAQLCYTPMLHAERFSRDPSYRAAQFQTCPADRPLVAQFCGHDAATLLAACRLVEGQVDAVDLNLGCPENIAKKYVRCVRTGNKDLGLARPCLVLGFQAVSNVCSQSHCSASDLDVGPPPELGLGAAFQ